MNRAQRKYTNRRYLDAIADHVVLFDGAMGTSIQAQAPVAADFDGEQYLGCVDYLSITRPDMIEAIHDSFLAVGCEVVETNTFRGNRLTLGEYGLGERTLEINRAAARLARQRLRPSRTQQRPAPLRRRQHGSLRQAAGRQ